LALALGMGAALLADVFLIKFIKDAKITEKEADILRTFSKAVWFGLAMFFISGVALTLPRLDTLISSAKFQVKIIAILVIIINGALLNTIVGPKLVEIFARETSKKFQTARKLAFGLGAVSVTSWFTAFLLGALRTLQINFGPLLALYVGILTLNILISQIVESQLFKKP